jgi:hypothetical protein
VRSPSKTTSLLAALGAAAFAVLGAPAAAADPGNGIACQPGQIVIDGQCSMPPPPTDTNDQKGSAPAGDQGGHHN